MDKTPRAAIGLCVVLSCTSLIACTPADPGADSSNGGELTSPGSAQVRVPLWAQDRGQPIQLQEPLALQLLDLDDQPLPGYSAAERNVFMSYAYASPISDTGGLVEIQQPPMGRYHLRVGAAQMDLDVDRQGLITTAPLVLDIGRGDDYAILTVRGSLQRESTILGISTGSLEPAASQTFTLCTTDAQGACNTNPWQAVSTSSEGRTDEAGAFVVDVRMPVYDAQYAIIVAGKSYPIDFKISPLPATTLPPITL